MMTLGWKCPDCRGETRIVKTICGNCNREAGMPVALGQVAACCSCGQAINEPVKCTTCSSKPKLARPKAWQEGLDEAADIVAAYAREAVNAAHLAERDCDYDGQFDNLSAARKLREAEADIRKLKETPCAQL